jgi:hypothetical protein
MQRMSGKPSVVHCFADAACLVFIIRPKERLDQPTLPRDDNIPTTMSGSGGPMHGWEYCTIDLNDLPRKTVVVDLLNGAGAEGWEMVAVTANQIAYMKREIARPALRVWRRRIIV